MTRKMKITFENSSLVVLEGRGLARAWCPRCAALVEWIALADVGVLSNLEKPELEQWFRSDELHRVPADDGSTVLCLPSLLNHLQDAVGPFKAEAVKQKEETR
jgi:hypothetical protein